MEKLHHGQRTIGGGLRQSHEITARRTKFRLWMSFLCQTHSLQCTYSTTLAKCHFMELKKMRKSIRNLVTLSLLLVLAGCAAGRPRPATAIREDADRLFHRGDYEHAVTHYREITERYPGDWEAQYRYGICQLELGNAYEARQALDIAHVRRPQHIGIVDALAEAIFQMGDESRLFTFLRERAESTQSVDAYLRLAK